MPKLPKGQAAEPGPGDCLAVALQPAARAVPEAAAGFPVDLCAAGAEGDGAGCSRPTALCPRLSQDPHAASPRSLPPGCRETTRIPGDRAGGADSAQAWAPRALARAVRRGHRGAARQRTRSNRHAAIGHVTGSPVCTQDGHTEVPFARGTPTSAPQAPGAASAPPAGPAALPTPLLLVDEPCWGRDGLPQAGAQRCRLWDHRNTLSMLLSAPCSWPGPEALGFPGRGDCLLF